jgi:short-subunit dehydrogenase
VVLAARREELLREAAAECKQINGRDALVVATDVSDEASVKRLGQQAFERFGRIDVWVNNAGVGAFGRFEEMPPEVFRQVIETNFFGTVYGSRAALTYMRQQKSGTIINTSSLIGVVVGPYYSAYSASKHAVRALGESMRQELEALDPEVHIHVCTVLPATIDTPFFRHSANYTGRAVKALPPVYPPEQVAATIVGCAEHPKRQVFVGNAGRMISLTHTLAPVLGEGMLAQQIDKGHFKPESAPATSGSTLSPMIDGSNVTDGWGGAAKTATRGLLTLGAVAATTGLLAWTWFRNQQ